MRRRLVLAVLLALPLVAHAQQTTTHLIFPSYGGDARYAWWDNNPNQLRCWRAAARLGITNATFFAAAVLASGDATAVCGFALYPDNNAGAVLVKASGSCHVSGLISNPSATPFSLAQGTIYRLCTCTTNAKTSGTWGYYISLAENNPLDPATKTGELNAGGTFAPGTAANPCVAGVPPSTTGALGGAGTVTDPPPHVVFDE